MKLTHLLLTGAALLAGVVSAKPAPEVRSPSPERGSPSSTEGIRTTGSNDSTGHCARCWHEWGACFQKCGEGPECSPCFCEASEKCPSDCGFPKCDNTQPEGPLGILQRGPCDVGAVARRSENVAVPAAQTCTLCSYYYNTCVNDCGREDGCGDWCRCDVGARRECRGECQYPDCGDSAKPRNIQPEGLQDMIQRGSSNDGAAARRGDEVTGPITTCQGCLVAYNKCFRECGGGDGCEEWCRCDVGDDKNCRGDCKYPDCGDSAKPRNAMPEDFRGLEQRSPKQDISGPPVMGCFTCQTAYNTCMYNCGFGDGCDEWCRCDVGSNRDCHNLCKYPNCGNSAKARKAEPEAIQGTMETTPIVRRDDDPSKTCTAKYNEFVDCYRVKCHDADCKAQCIKTLCDSLPSDDVTTCNSIRESICQKATPTETSSALASPTEIKYCSDCNAGEKYCLEHDKCDDDSNTKTRCYTRCHCEQCSHDFCKQNCGYDDCDFVNPPGQLGGDLGRIWHCAGVWP